MTVSVQGLGSGWTRAAQNQAAKAGAVERSEEAASRQLPAEASSQEGGTEGVDSRLISVATSMGKMKTWNSSGGQGGGKLCLGLLLYAQILMEKKINLSQ